METVTILKSDFELLCQIVQGLQVPVSLNRNFLGTAYEPWSEIHNSTGFGWRDTAVYQEAILERAEKATQQEA